MALSTLILVCLVFVLAGFTKGIIGLGLPTIAMGLLAVVLPPAEAAALLILPSLVTNVWQMLDGPHLGRLLRRLWPLNLGVCLGTWLGAALLAGIGGRHGGLALGVALIAYAASAWPRCAWSCRARPSLSLAHHRRTDGRHHGGHRRVRHSGGSLPAGDRPAEGRAGAGARPLLHRSRRSRWRLHWPASTPLPDLLLPSLLAVVVSLAGMRLGQAVRARLRPQTFRLCFFLGLLALGAYLALRGLG